jgi:thymidylate synthase (FAD)
MLATKTLEQAYTFALESYDMLLQLGVAREQARSVIPVGHTTMFYATANLLNWAKFCKLRSTPEAQFEIRELSDKVSEILSQLYPTPWKYLNA